MEEHLSSASHLFMAHRDMMACFMYKADFAWLTDVVDTQNDGHCQCIWCICVYIYIPP